MFLKDVEREVPLYPENELHRDKTNKMACAPSENSDQPGHRPGWSESSLCAQLVAKDPMFHHADSEDSNQTGRMIWVFAGRIATLLVLSCGGSNDEQGHKKVKWAVTWQNKQNDLCAHWGLRSAQSDQSSLSTWRSIGPLATHIAHSEDSDQTGRMASSLGAQVILLVLSCNGSNINCIYSLTWCKENQLLYGCRKQQCRTCRKEKLSKISNNKSQSNKGSPFQIFFFSDN